MDHLHTHTSLSLSSSLPPSLPPCHQIFKRNPLCGIDYPCGKANLTNTCMEISPMEEFVFRPENESVSLPQGLRLCNQPNTALFSTILCLSTIIIALILKKFRQGKFLGKTVRERERERERFSPLSLPLHTLIPSHLHFPHHTLTSSHPHILTGTSAGQ